MKLSENTFLHNHPVPIAGPEPQTFHRQYVWQVPIRIFHWVNAVCITVLFLTGLYLATPLVLAMAGPRENLLMASVRQIHLFFALIFIVNFMWRIYWFWMGNKYARSGFPFVWRLSWWRDLFRQGRDYLRLNFGHAHLGHNALAGLSYTIFAIGLGWVQILTGLALYGESDRGGFWDTLFGWVIPLLGGSFSTRMWHHLAGWGFLFFAIIHVYIVLLDGYQYKNGLISSMISGMKFYEVKELDRED